MASTDLMRTRDFYLSTEFFGDHFENIALPLIQHFDPKKGVPLDIERPSDYYATTTCTTLLALYHMKLLDNETLTKFHEIIFRLRDHSTNPILKAKSPEDMCAWDVAESACVWATSLAVWALLETRYSGNRSGEIKTALLWLADQQRPGGGWGYDIKGRRRVFFTSLVLHALKLGLASLELTHEETNKMNRAITDGIRFILNARKIEGNLVYWSSVEGSDDPDPTSTLYSLWALFEYDRDQYQATINKGLQFIRNDLKGKEIWDIKEIVSETETKYSTHKVIITFTPAFPILLLKLGVSPFDEMCMKPIMWLRENRTNKGWKLPDHSENALAFTTALALWTINRWHRLILKENIKEGRRHPLILKRLYNRITALLVLVIGLTAFIVISFTPLLQITSSVLVGIVEHYGVWLSLLASILAIIGISGLIPTIKYIDTRFLNRRIGKFIARCVGRIRHAIYAK